MDDAMTDVPYPQGYRTCPTCGAYMGSSCKTVGATVVNGVVQGPATKIDHPHLARKVRSGWR